MYVVSARVRKLCRAKVHQCVERDRPLGVEMDRPLGVERVRPLGVDRDRPLRGPANSLPSYWRRSDGSGRDKRTPH